MDITEMLGYLATDLKMTLDTEFTTAEGTRAIHKAVDELSRHIPRERIYEQTWIKAVTDDTFTTPATEDPDYLVDAMDLPNTVVDGSVATLTATVWLDVPRPITFTLTDGNNSITRMTLVVKGTDADGVYREERFYRHGGKVQTGKIYFSYIQEIEFSEITGNVTGDVLDVGTAEPNLASGGVWVKLSNPIESGTETIYSAALKAGTKYTKDTDYEMDYANGRIRMKYGGTLADGTIYYANYSRASTSIDISNIIPELIRVNKVLYPVGKVPEQQAAITIWENMLTIGSLKQGESQTTLSDKDHVAIYFEGKHSPPTLVSGGSYPDLLDEVVLMGAAGHVLLIEALQYEQAAVTDLASMRTELGLTTAIQALAVTALNKAAVLVTATTGGIAVALAAGDAAFALGATAVAKITTNVAEFMTKVYTANDAMATALGKVTTIDIDAATVGATAWLLEGELLINRLNDGGPDVANKFADYARAKIQIAQERTQQALGYAQEAQSRLAGINSYIAEAGADSRIGEGYVASAQTEIGLANAALTEAQTRILQIDKYLAEAAQYQEAAGVNLILADRFRAEGQARLNDFRAVLASKAEYRKRTVSVSVRQPG